MHIAIISVAPPYRGGISKFTSTLVKRISKKHLIKVINFKRQYPYFLFPGKSQLLKTNDYLGERCIDSINPLNWYNVGRKIAKGKFDLVIFNIWNPFFSPSLGMIASQVSKKSPNTKLISLCHNILPHEKIPFGKILISYVLNKMHGHIVLSSQVEKELNEILTNPIYTKKFHPIYDSYSDKIRKSEAKQELNITAKKNIILFFGLIRPYKGFEILLKSISLLKDKNISFHLIVAGECYQDKKQYIELINNLKISNYMTWHDSYIPDNDVVKYFSVADVVVLPYTSASQSGISQIAYNYNMPIIVSDVGGLPEMVIDGKTGFIFKSGDSNMLFEKIFKILMKTNRDAMSNYIFKYKNKFSWIKFIEGIEELYGKL